MFGFTSWQYVGYSHWEVFATGPALMVCAYWVRLAAVAPKAVESWRRRRRKTRLLQRGEGGGGPRTLQVPGDLLPGTLGLMTLMGLSLSKGAPRKRRAGTRGGGGGRVRGYKKRRLTLTLHRAEGKSTEPELPTEPRLATRVSFTSAAFVCKRHAARRCPGPPHLPQVRPAFINEL